MRCLGLHPPNFGQVEFDAADTPLCQNANDENLEKANGCLAKRFRLVRAALARSARDIFQAMTQSGNRAMLLSNMPLKRSAISVLTQGGSRAMAVVYHSAFQQPILQYRFREIAKDTPTMKSKKGMTKSARRMPFQGLWCMSGKSAPTMSTNTISAMLSPRNTSSDCKRCLIGTPDDACVGVVGVEDDVIGCCTEPASDVLRACTWAAAESNRDTTVAATTLPLYNR